MNPMDDNQKTIPAQGPPSLHGILRSLTLDNPVAAMELRHQCEEGTVSVRVFVKLLDLGYRKPPEGNGKEAEGPRMIYLKEGETPFDYWDLHPTAMTPRPTQIQSFTLGNPRVVRRLQGEWEDGTMPTAIRNWFLAYGPELLRKETERRRPLLYYSPSGRLPWHNDPMKEQEDKAIAAQKAQNKMDERARPSRKLEQQGSDAGDQEAEDPEAPQLYRPKED